MESKRPLYGKRTLAAIGVVALLTLASLPLLSTVTRNQSLSITLAFEKKPQDTKNRRIQSVDVNVTTQKPLDLTTLIHSLDLGWERPPPKWLNDLCPEVVEHFNKFPSFKKLPHPAAPFMTTEYAAHSVCTLKIAKLVASSMLKTHLYVHAGSHLGAILHSQPILWDDDVDAIMSHEYMEDFFSICQHGHRVHEDAELRCSKDFNAIKVWLQSSGMTKQTANGRQHYSPFVDLFFFNITETGRLNEVAIWKSDSRTMPSFPVKSFFPTQAYYFGGIHILGPNLQLAKHRYNFKICKTANWNHRLEDYVPEFYRGKLLDCTLLAKRFPFRQSLNLVTNGNHSQRLVPIESRHLNLKTKASVMQRATWFHQPFDVGQNLTNDLPGLNTVEVDNTISTSCTTHGDKLRVVEFNAERGRWWLEAATNLDELKQAHVIILNEMDIGMARTDQQHTARQMAHFLGMNYAWGLEFVELTIGNQQDRASTPNRLPNFNGLRGNAILSRCAIDDAVIYRNQVGDYFSDEKKWLNADGLEKRLGGRMILLGRIVVNNVPVVIGSVHKLGEGHGPEITKYIGSSKAVIAGDQHDSFCGNVGLKAVVPKDQKGNTWGHTWPASCNGFGTQRGDNICTNMEELEPELTTKPCVTELGMETELGDHALTGVVLGVSSAMG